MVTPVARYPVMIECGERSSRASGSSFDRDRTRATAAVRAPRSGPEGEYGRLKPAASVVVTWRPLAVVVRTRNARFLINHSFLRRFRPSFRSSFFCDRTRVRIAPGSPFLPLRSWRVAEVERGRSERARFSIRRSRASRGWLSTIPTGDPNDLRLFSRGLRYGEPDGASPLSPPRHRRRALADVFENSLLDQFLRQ